MLPRRAEETEVRGERSKFPKIVGEDEDEGKAISGTSRTFERISFHSISRH